MGYIIVRFGLWIYNKLTPHLGGIEFEFEPVVVTQAAQGKAPEENITES